MRMIAISSDFRAFHFVAHLLQIWAACPLPEKFSFGNLSAHLAEMSAISFLLCRCYAPYNSNFKTPKNHLSKSLSQWFSKKIKKEPPPQKVGGFSRASNQLLERMVRILHGEPEFFCVLSYHDVDHSRRRYHHLRILDCPYRYKSVPVDSLCLNCI